MPFARPTIQRLINRAKADIEALLENGASRVRRSVEYVMAHVSAGLAHGQHGHIQYVSQQILPTDADEEWLLRHASVWGIERRPATAAEFTILVKGQGDNFIPAGTEWSRADGALFESVEDATVPAIPPREVSVLVRATYTPSDPEHGTGTEGNTEAGTTLSLTNPIPNVLASATVEGTLGELQGGAADLETIESVRQRVLDRVRTPPSGGGPGDYVDWAKTVSGVSRAWELPKWLGPGTVLVLFVQDVIDADGNFVTTIFPDGSMVAEVQAVIDSLAPVTAVPTVAAPGEVHLDPDIQLSPNTPAAQAQVIAGLNDLLLRRARPGGTLLLSEINEAISLAPDEDDHILISPVANVTVGPTQILTLGAVTFSDIP